MKNGTNGTVCYHVPASRARFTSGFKHFVEFRDLVELWT